MPNPADMYKQKKKRAVDPNAPPRPTLLGHEKVIKDAKATIDQQQDHIAKLEFRMHELEAKVRRLSDYCNQLHQYIQSILNKK